MVNLLNWKYDGTSMWGVCVGHEELADGDYIRTSPIAKMEPCQEGLNFFTVSGTNYYCKTVDIDLDTLEETMRAFKNENIDISFLDNTLERVENHRKKIETEIFNLIDENDLYIEFVGMLVIRTFFKKDGVLIPLECFCHSGMTVDSYLITKPGIIDVRYFDHLMSIDFYQVSEGINYIYIKYTGDLPFGVTGIGNGLHFAANTTETQRIKAEPHKYSFFEPASFDMEEGEDWQKIGGDVGQMD